MGTLKDDCFSSLRALSRSGEDENNLFGQKAGERVGGRERREKEREGERASRLMRQRGETRENRRRGNGRL